MVESLGIRLHTSSFTIYDKFEQLHLGRSIILEHYRMNAECGEMEQLEPIDINLQYDTNFQQTTLFPREVTVLPVSWRNKQDVMNLLLGLTKLFIS